MITIDLCGGLGDAFIKIHETVGYELLETLKPEERASVRIISHNPFVREIFSWHPRRDQIDVYVANFFFLDYENPALRRSAGVPEIPEQPLPSRQRAPVKFYPSPGDFVVIEQELPRGDFLAVAPTASGMEIENRDLPPEIMDPSVAAAQTAGIPIVLLGRTYSGPHPPKDRYFRPVGPGIVDLTDRLSVPGTAEVVRRARALLSAHSCLLLLAWYARKPSFVTYPLRYAEADFRNPNSPFAFGRDYPETVHMPFNGYSRRAFEKFLKENF
jgi:hypothetical protein